MLNSAFFDGSVVLNSDLISAITHCIDDLGYAAENVVVDGIYSMPRDLQQVDTTGWTSLWMLKRFFTINHYYHQWDGLLRSTASFPHVQFRHLIFPADDGTIPDNIYPLNYNQKQVDSCYNYGVAAGENSIPSHPDSTDNYFEYIALKRIKDESVFETTYEQFLENKKTSNAEPFDWRNHPFLKALYTIE